MPPVTTSANPVLAAKKMRDAQMRDARKTFKDSMDSANQEFADFIRSQTDTKPVVELAEDAGITRQTLYGILGRFPSQT